MRHAFQVIEGAPTATLPVLATPSDVREVVQFLKKKPEGVTAVEASDAVRKRLFDPRKVAAYEFWGIISKHGDRMKLSVLGREFASKLEPEAQIYRVMLDNAPPYRTVLEWIHQQNLDLVTCADIAEYWGDRFPEALQRVEKTPEGHVVSFLHLCHAAEIGTATIGRKGQPSRLRVDRDELAAYMHANPRQGAERVLDDALRSDARRPPPHGPAASQRLRVFISAPQGSRIVASVKDALQLADIESEVVERDTSAAEFVSERAFQAMRRCDAGIIIMSLADCHRDAGRKDALDQRVLIEIGAAFVHFARRVILLRGKQVPIPFNLNDFCHYEPDGDELTWDTGIQLVKSVKLMRADPR